MFKKKFPRIKVLLVLSVLLAGILPVNAQEADPASVDFIRSVKSSSGDLKIILADVHMTDHLFSLTLQQETSMSPSYASEAYAVYINGEKQFEGAGIGIEPGHDVTTQTFAWYGYSPESPWASLSLTWESLLLDYEGISFILEDEAGNTLELTAEDYAWPFRFHNPAVSSFNADGMAAAVDDQGIHTLGNEFDITLGGGVITDGPDGKIYSFNLITESDLLNLYGSQEGMWFNGQQRMGGGSSVALDGDGNPEIPEDTKFRQTDHFVYMVPDDFIPSSLTVTADSLSFEIGYAENDYTMPGLTWSTSLSGPVEIVKFTL